MSETKEALFELKRDFEWRANVCLTNLDAYDAKAAAVWEFAAKAVAEKIDAL